MLTRKTPLRRTPMKRKRKRPIPKTVENYRGWIASKPCLVCGVHPVTVHHVTASIHGGRISRSEQRLTPLCRVHHQAVWDPCSSRPVSVEGLGHRGFYRVHGIDLLAVAEALWEEYSA